ncbi:MAG: sugar ABC transporter ATP-binding protein [Clostridiales Family XIII bacterium]|nr:sugar ABC transporter ATP-binding protein [Clostridiales Family XIII bacterium]
MASIIRFEHISKSFSGVRALDDVSFDIETAQVHALVGENGAGKSTLMNILSGLLTQDAGSIIYKGAETKIGTPAAARKHGIATVFQELKNCDNLTVAENIFLGREYKNGIRPDWRGMNEKAQEILDSYGIDVDVRASLHSLSVAQKQIIEIAKAIDLNADVLILDEPTSALTVNETKHLFENIRRLKEQSVTIIFISHRLDEIFEIADVISVLRSGQYLGTHKAADVSANDIIRMIAGKDLMTQYASVADRDFISPKKVLEVSSLSRTSLVRDVSFSLFEGEILGFYGLQGSGRTELMETIFGTQKKTAGSIRVFDHDIQKSTSRKSIRGGLSMLMEERKTNGLFFNMSVNENIAIIHEGKISWHGVLNKRSMKRMASAYISQLSIRCSDQRQPVGKLSGGNQQKVALSRCLSTEPSILILDEPTRGVDVGAKAEIYEILRRLRKENHISMIVVSSELPEVIMLSDRVLVMHNGCITGELQGDEINEKSILQYAFNETGSNTHEEVSYESDKERARY